MYNYYEKNGKERSVRNLGWFMRYASKHIIKEIVVNEHSGLDFDITFHVYFDNNVVYHCDFKDKTVFYKWLGNRRSLHGVQIKRVIHGELTIQCGTIKKEIYQYGTIEKEIYWR